MPVQSSEVQIGAFFITPNDQLRKVTKITIDEQSRTQVHYLSKSAKIQGRAFSFAATKAKPPLMDTFISDCDHLLSDLEIKTFRTQKIILDDE